jgi:hypothetical protein
MFCPKCGQEQVAEVPNFCLRCGFPLTQVTSLLESGGAPGETRENKPPPDKVRRCGLRLLVAALAFLVLSIFSAAAEGDVSVSIFGFLTFASFVIGSSVLIYSWIKGRMRRRSESTPLGQQTSRMEAPQRGALLPTNAPPVTIPKARFDTGEIAQPPSVTEHTTRQLEHAPPGERERTPGPQ